MYLYQEMNQFDFIDAFKARGRGDQFSPPALWALYYHLSEWAQDTGEPIKIDVVGICCEWQELFAGEIIEQYCGPDYKFDVEDIEDEIKSIEHIYNLTIIPVPQYDHYTYLVAE